MAVIVLIAGPPKAAPGNKAEQKLIEQVRDKYSRLGAFAMHIDHQDTSGLFQGKYSQNLRWRKGGVFELVAVSKDVKNEKDLPNYYASGREVVEVLPNKQKRYSPVALPPGTSAGWETGGGSILSWLQATEAGDWAIGKKIGQAVSWKFGPRTVWHGLKCRELKLSGKPAGSRMSIFVDEKDKTLLGMETDILHKVGWELYSKQDFNPVLPSTLGKLP